MMLDPKTSPLPARSGEEEGNEAAEVFAWDEWEEPLPLRLAQLWQTSKDGSHRVDIKSLLDGVP